MSIKIWSVVVFLLLGSLATAQDCTYKLTGSVKDFHDGSEIIGASILIKGTQKFTTTDFNGNFELKNICSQQFEVIIEHISCETKTFKVDLSKKQSYVFRLEHHVEKLSEVKLVTSTGKHSKTAQENLLRSEVLENYSALSLGNAIAEIPGVSSINTGSSIVKPVINGLHSSRVLVLNNNVRLEDQEWGIEHAPNVDINAANSVSVIKGPNALEYGGDAIGGVIILNPKRAIKKDSLFGKTIIGSQTNGRGYNFNTSLRKTYTSGLYFNGQASYKRFGDYETPDYSLTNTANNSKNFTVTAGYNTLEKGFEVFYSYVNNEIGILRSSHIGNIEDLVNAINSDTPAVTDPFSYDINHPKQKVTHQVVKANFYKRFEKFGKLDIQYDYQNNHRYEFDIRVGDDRDKPAVDLTLQTHTLKSTLTLDSKDSNRYKVGVLGTLQDNFANPATGVRRLIPDYKKFGLGAFVIGNFRINDHLTLDAGTRYDFTQINANKFYYKSRWQERGYDQEFNHLIVKDFGTQLLVNPVLNYHNISASLGASYAINNKNSILINYGLASRAPNVSELFSDGLHHSAARIELGDLRIKKEVSNRFAASHFYKSEKFSLTTELFYNRINNFIYIEPSGIETTIRGAFPVWDYKQVNALLYGIDISLRYNVLNHLSLLNKSSLIKGKDISSNRALIDIPSFKTTNSVRYENSEWSNFMAELQSVLVLQQNEYPNNNFDVFLPQSNSYKTVDISTPPPGYHLINLKSSVDINMSKNKNLTVSLAINNVFDTSYREYLNRLRFFADDLGRNLMIQLKFNY